MLSVLKHGAGMRIDTYARIEFLAVLSYRSVKNVKTIIDSYIVKRTSTI